MNIGPHLIDPPLVLAPMAGVTDRPFRIICRTMGAGLAVTEMLGSDPAFSNTAKTLRRINHEGETGPISVQIAGSEPEYMASAAAQSVARGAQIIDINMGCPAKKVCNKAAGSALLRDEKLVASILRAVVGAVDVPVTLKIRTGWCPDSRNAVSIGRIAEQSGISALTIHGRTRQDRFRGSAEYDTIAQVKQSIGIPVIANGDIDSVHTALAIKRHTGADGLMIGRGAQGQPWLFSAIAAALDGEEAVVASDRRPETAALGRLIYNHVAELHGFYGLDAGVKIVRKHLGWYLDHCGLPVAAAKRFRSEFNTLLAGQLQLEAIQQFFEYGEADNSSQAASNDRQTLDNHIRPLHNYKESAA